MLNAFAALIGAQLTGELLRQLFHLPLPGSVIGMFILAIGLLLRRDIQSHSAELTNVANTLITNMGLLFVPAGVGIVAEGDLLRHYWFPILVGLVFSTVLGLLVTGLVMHHSILWTRRSRPDAEKKS